VIVSIPNFIEYSLYYVLLFDLKRLSFDFPLGRLHLLLKYFAVIIKQVYFFIEQCLFISL
jgi:hypothetical protein